MSRTFVMGDIHGAQRAFVQCLERSGFDREQDQLIYLGDVCDGWPDTQACVDELLTLKNLTYILGNHDFWTKEWMETGVADDVWLSQGGEATVQSYQGIVNRTHLDFFRKALPYHLLGDKLFVHAGIDPTKPLEAQGLTTFLWNRALALSALEAYHQKQTHKLVTFDEVYIGHTPIPFDRPIYSGGVWLMDTGAGWSGVLSMMDVDTKEIFTSDVVSTLYPGVLGRTKKK